MLRIDSRSWLLTEVRRPTIMIRMLLPRALLCAVLSLVCALSLALDADQDAPPDSNQFVQEMIVRAHQKLTTGLYKTFARKPGNLIISPWSVMTLLTLTYMVAGGRTANEIGDHLNINLLRRKEILDGFKHINDIFQTDAANSSGIPPSSSEVLKSLNGALLGKRVRPNRRLQKQLKDSLSTYLHKVFARGGPGHRTPVVMPPWSNDTQMMLEGGGGGGEGGGEEVLPSASPTPPAGNGSGQQLQGLIPGEEGLESKLSFWLFNWMLFQGQWRSPFSPRETHGAEFWAQGREKVVVPTMTVKARFPRAHDQDLNVTLLELPYGHDSDSSGVFQGQASGRFGMFILLPDARAGLGRLEKKLRHFTLEALLTQPLWDRSAKVFLPKFKFRTDIMLNEAMKKMGYKRMFDPNEADFARLVPKRRKGKRSPYVQTMVHRATIEVDEKGTVASASSALKLSFRKYVPIVRVDHPFMFVLRDKALGINLFIGRVTDPREL